MNNNDINKYTYEQAISELDQIVNQLETGKAPLEKSVELYQRGVELTRYCESLLSKAENKIMILAENESGQIEETPFPLSNNNMNEENQNE